jgi:hypothetical protein
MSALVDLYYRGRIAAALKCRLRDLFLRSVHLPRLRAIYLPNPKVAGSTIMATLVPADGSQHLAGLAEYNSDESRRRLSSEHDPAGFWAALNDRAYYRFAFVRDPYARAASAYLDKIASRREPRFAGRLRLQQDASFVDFLAAVSRQRPREMNRHWRPQSLLIPIGVKLSFLGRFENFDADFAAVKDALGVSAPTVSRREHGSGGGAHDELLGPRERALIEEVYAEDFRRFGYARLAGRVAA